MLAGAAVVLVSSAGTFAHSQEQTPPKPKAKVCVIRLHGAVGGLNEGEVLKTFDAELLERFFRRAKQEKAVLAVLDIETPGGRVDEMSDICRKIVEYHDQLRIVAWVGDGLSAGAVISLTCREIVVKPIARIGAALTVFIDRDGRRVTLDEKRKKEADYLKLVSVDQAADRAFMAASGRPVELIEAMTIQVAELWWSPKLKQFSARGPSAFGSSADWQQLDDRDNVLTLTGVEAVKMGVAAGTAVRIEDVPGIIGITVPVEILDLSFIVERRNKDVNRRIEAFYAQANRHLRGLYEIEREMSLLPTGNWSGPPSRRNPARVEVSRRLRRISEQAAICRTALRAMTRIDRLLIERRIERSEDLRGEIVSRIDVDLEAIEQVRQMLDQYREHDVEARYEWLEAKAWLKATRTAWDRIVNQDTGK